MLLIDIRFVVAGKIVESRDQGIIYGQGGELCVMKYISGQAKIKKGETVITSGTGGIFPESIPIGEIVDVEPSSEGMFLTAQVKPFVDFGKLDNLLVIQSQGFVEKSPGKEEEKEWIILP